MSNNKELWVSQRLLSSSVQVIIQAVPVIAVLFIARGCVANAHIQLYSGETVLLLPRKCYLMISLTALLSGRNLSLCECEMLRGEFKVPVSVLGPTLRNISHQRRCPGNGSRWRRCGGTARRKLTLFSFHCWFWANWLGTGNYICSDRVHLVK